MKPVEALPETVSSSPTAHIPAAAAEVRAGSNPLERPSGGRPRFDALAQLRLDLQRRSSSNLRRHLARAVRRLTVLIIADVASFGLMRALLRAVRDSAVLGHWIAGHVASVLPRGLFNGWEYSFALLIGLVVMGNYGAGDKRRSPSRLLAGTALATALLLWHTVWVFGDSVVIVQLLLVTALVWAGLLTERLVVDHVVGLFATPGAHALPALFVGDAEACRQVMTRPAFSDRNEFRAIGIVDTKVPPEPDAIGGIVDFGKILADTRAEAVVFCGSLPDDQFRDVVDLALAGGCHVMSVPRALEVAWVQPTVVWRRNQPLMELVSPGLKGWQLLLKRATDVALASIGLLVLSPVFMLIALAIRLDSPGPIFFSQERVGLGGRRFRMLKFRSMRIGADAEKAGLAGLNHTGDSRLFKIPNDPRVTRVGAWLRRWSLDEIPQLINVALGSMSLVGPRPFFEGDLADYEPHHFVRLAAKPGITGLWQVAGRSSIVDFEEVVRLDREYVERWSLLLDLQILFLTLPAVVRRTGAY